jgi:hypothetical protein
MKTSTRIQPALLSQVRESFREHASSLPRQPNDRDLTDLVYLTELARSAPVGITHGRSHRDLAAAIRTILRVLPNLIDAAEDAAAAAKVAGRATDMGHFAWRGGALLAAARPFTPITSRRDARGAWHGWAAQMEFEVRFIMKKCGKTRVSVSHETSPALRIIAQLLGKSESQVVNALREWKKAGK